MNRPLSFLHLTTFYPPYSFGGDATYVHRLAHALGSRGHRVDVVHSIDAYHLLSRDEPAPLAPQPSDSANVTSHGLKGRLPLLGALITNQTGWPLFNRGAIRDLLALKSYDVVHFHNVAIFGPGLLPLAAAIAGDALRLYTAHEHWLICPTHVLWKFNRRLCERPQCVRCTVMAKRPPQFWRYTGLMERSVEAVDRFLSPSRFTAAIHRARGFPAPMAYLPQFAARADRDWIEPGPRPHPRPYFLFVGRLEIIKGAAGLIDRWAEIPDTDLLIAGTGGQEALLRARAASNPRVRFLGWIPPDRLGALYFHSVAVIVPSLTYEVFPIVILEAFARKTPAIVRDLGPLPEVIGESRGGLVYHSELELAGAVRRLLASPALRSELGENGYRVFVERWSEQAHLQAYFAILRETAMDRFGRVPWEMEAAPQASAGPTR